MRRVDDEGNSTRAVLFGDMDDGFNVVQVHFVNGHPVDDAEIASVVVHHSLEYPWTSDAVVSGLRAI